MKSINVIVNCITTGHCHSCGRDHTNRDAFLLGFSMPDNFNKEPHEIMNQVYPCAANVGFEINENFDPITAVAIAADDYAKKHGGTVFIMRADMTSDLQLQCDSYCEEDIEEHAEDD